MANELVSIIKDIEISLYHSLVKHTMPNWYMTRTNNMVNKNTKPKAGSENKNCGKRQH